MAELIRLAEKSRGCRPGPLVVDPNHGVDSEQSILSLRQWMRDGVDAD